MGVSVTATRIVTTLLATTASFAFVAAVIVGVL